MDEAKTKSLFTTKESSRESTDPCIRIELKITNQHDLERLMDDYLNGMTFAEITTGFIALYLQFVPSGPGRKDRRKPYKWWTEFLGGIAVRKLNRPQKEKDQEASDRWYCNVLKKLKKEQGLDIWRRFSKWLKRFSPGSILFIYTL